MDKFLKIVLHVALNTWTNYINEVAQTEIDFPVIRPQRKIKIRLFIDCGPET